MWSFSAYPARTIKRKRVPRTWLFVAFLLFMACACSSFFPFLPSSARARPQCIAFGKFHLIFVTFFLATLLICCENEKNTASGPSLHFPTSYFTSLTFPTSHFFIFPPFPFHLESHTPSCCSLNFSYVLLSSFLLLSLPSHS